MAVGARAGAHGAGFAVFCRACAGDGHLGDRHGNFVATRAGLKTNEDILDVLHQIGAQDSFISRRFETHFVKLTAIASALGFLAWAFFMRSVPWFRMRAAAVF